MAVRDFGHEKACYVWNRENYVRISSIRLRTLHAFMNKGKLTSVIR